MRLSTSICAAFLAGCAGARTGPAAPPPARFGYVTGLIGDAPFVGTFAHDSVVAIYMRETGSLQIEGDRAIGGRMPLVRVDMRCLAEPAPGVYAVRGMRTPVYAEAFVGGSDARWWHRGEPSRGLLSDSVPPGVLELDTLDLTRGRIYGRFQVTLRSNNRAPAESLVVSATFWGRVIAPTLPLPSGLSPGRWAPDIDRDCAAVRGPLRAATARDSGAPMSSESLQPSGSGVWKK